MAEDTVRARVAGGEFFYEREHYERGDELEVEPKVLDSHPRTLERIESGDETTDDSDDTVAVEDLDPHPSELTVDELEERIADVEDVDLLEAIKDAETETKERQTAIEAIDARLDELET